VLVVVALALAVLGVTAALVFSAPAREAELAAQGSSTRIVHVQAGSSGLHSSLAVQPGEVGINTLAVTPGLIAPGRFLPTALSGRLTAPGGSRPRSVRFTPLTDGRWVASVSFTRAGIWSLELVESDGSSSSRQVLRIAVG
jgi:hypothetical protein